MELRDGEITGRLDAELLKAVFDTAVDGIVTINEVGTIINANLAIEHLFGYHPDELIGKNVKLLMPEPYVSQHDAYLANYRETQEKKVIGIGREVHGKRKDGTEFPIDLAVAETITPNGPVFTGIIRDISDRKLAEQLVLEKEVAEKASASKSEFLSRMSHEFRTPLNAILGFSQLLELEELSDVQRDNVRYIITSGQHLLRLINDILEISKVELSTFGMSLEAVSVRDVMNESLGLVKSAGDIPKIKIEYDSQEYMLRADAQRLRQVFVSILSNAIKFNRPGGSVRVSHHLRDEIWVDTIITDTGVGIPAGKMSKLFVPFERLGAEATTIEGSGLGLALSKSLVEAMGGEITVESKVGQGSTFRISLPLLTEKSSTMIVFGDTPGIDLSLERGSRILVIEDNIVNTALLQKIFAKRKGVELMIASDGGTGLAMAESNRPDLILLDLHLPDLGGREVLRELKSNEELKHIPVIIVSADTYSTLKQTLLEEGAVAYLTKPIDINLLVKAVGEALQVP